MAQLVEERVRGWGEGMMMLIERYEMITELGIACKL